jgi:hypothetical protein
MNGRSLTAAAVLTTLAMLAGCLAPNDFLNASSTKLEITAMEDRDLADNAAQAWSPGAVLVSVFSIELADAGHNSSWPADPHVGNGKAPAWVYAYQAADGNGTKAFRVTANGRVTTDNESDDMGMGDMGSMGDAVSSIAQGWKIDSDKALASALKNESFSGALKGGNLTLAEGVAAMDNATAYYFAAVGMHGMAIATVDASNGHLLSVKSFDMPAFDMGGMGDMGSFSTWGEPVNEKGKGTVSEAKPKMEFPFHVASPQGAKFSISYDPSLPTDGLRWSLVGPDGKALKAQGGNGSGDPTMMRGEPGSVTYQLPASGAYKVVVQYESNVPDPVGLGGVSFSWTLKGMMMGNAAGGE